MESGAASRDTCVGDVGQRKRCLVVRNPDHYVRGLDHGPAVGALAEPELLDRLDRDRCDHTLPIDIELDVGDRLPPSDLSNRGRELVAS